MQIMAMALFFALSPPHFAQASEIFLDVLAHDSLTIGINWTYRPLRRSGVTCAFVGPSSLSVHAMSGPSRLPADPF